MDLRTFYVKSAAVRRRSTLADVGEGKANDLSPGEWHRAAGTGVAVRPSINLSRRQEMTKYGCDLGFDWNNPGPLQYGLMDKDNSDAPAWFTKLLISDVLFFDLYDITPLGSNSSPVSVQAVQFVMTFTDMRTQNIDTPLEPASSYFWPSATPLNIQTGNSAVFSGQTLNFYPIGAITDSSSPQFGQQFTATKSGSFNLSIAVIVTATVGTTTATQIFSFDPEMIIGGGDGPSDGDQRPPKHPGQPGHRSARV
jgi:hypothetical protein